MRSIAITIPNNCLFALFASLAIWTNISVADEPQNETWAKSIALPDTETPRELFDRTSFEGWQGLIDDFWSIENGEIVGRNLSPIPASTYLFTKDSYREFRLLMEVKQTLGKDYSTMHSAVCCLGQIIEDKGQAFGFRGPLLMFCHDWGIWDAHRRNRIYPSKHRGNFRPGVERIGEWNQIEVLVIGDRIRMVVNGQLVIDMTDNPQMLQSSPIGLQLHGNQRPQEFRFRGLVLSKSPTDQLLTLSPK
ncbi:MAG: 3-keto-disaccharide hydrolase [Rubripirellula sp.]